MDNVTSEQQDMQNVLRILSVSPMAAALSRLPDGQFVAANDAFLTMHGYTREEVIGHTSEELHLWNRLEERAGMVAMLKLEDRAHNFAHEYREKSGRVGTAKVSAIRLEIDGQTYLLGFLTDASALDDKQRRLIDSERTAEALFASMLNGMAYCRMLYENERPVDFVYLKVNRSFEKQTGLQNVEGKKVSEVIPGIQQSDPELFEIYGRVASTGIPETFEIYVEGLKAWFSISVFSPEQHYFVAVFEVITNKKEADELIWRQANFDALTQLPNRRMLRDRMKQETKKALRSGLQFALMFIDLDHFKEINDTLGHAKGDQLIAEAARRLVHCVRETDTVSRLGGDEFNIMLTELEDARDIERIAFDILEHMAQPFILGDDTVTLSASIGITLFPTDSRDIDELIKNADQAMYVSKRAGRNRYSYYTPSLQENARKRLTLINDLRHATARNELRVHFQPVVELKSGDILKAEALVRWQHPVRGLISPAEFIPIAEDTGLIIDIGNWVFKESAKWTKRWTHIFRPDFSVSINKSPVQFLRDHSDNDWIDYLHELDLPGSSIVVEITESILIDSDNDVTGRLASYREHGIQIAVDDFGTGYSALSYLKKFNIDYLKIDQSFTRNLAPGSSDLALSEAIIVMAHKLGLKVIAEGIETEDQRQLLLAAGCDYGQGFLFSRPLPPEEFEQHFLSAKQSELTP